MRAGRWWEPHHVWGTETCKDFRFNLQLVAHYLSSFHAFLFHIALLKNNLFIYFWLCLVSLAALGLSLVAARGAALCCSARNSYCGGFSRCGAWALGIQASVVVAQRLRCSTACGIFLDQGSNPCPLNWQADS